MNQDTPKFRKLFDALEEIFGTVSAPVREVNVIEPAPPDRGPDYFAQQIVIMVRIDSRSNSQRALANDPGRPTKSTVF